MKPKNMCHKIWSSKFVSCHFRRVNFRREKWCQKLTIDLNDIPEECGEMITQKDCLKLDGKHRLILVATRVMAVEHVGRSNLDATIYHLDFSWGRCSKKNNLRGSNWLDVLGPTCPPYCLRSFSVRKAYRKTCQFSTTIDIFNSRSSWISLNFHDFPI